MSDELLQITEDLRKKMRQAGEDKLNGAQIARILGVTDHECRVLMTKHPELYAEYIDGETKWALKSLQAMKDIVLDPDNKNHFAAARYLYDLYSNRQTANQTVIMNQNVYKNDNQKLIEILDAETIARIEND